MKTNFCNKTLILVLILIMALVSVGCSKSDNDETATNKPQPQEQQEQQESIYLEEDEDADVSTVKTELSSFYGSWTAASDKAHYLYGNVDITVNEDKTWTADITGESLQGTWAEEGDHIHMSNDLFSFDLALTSKGNVIMIEDIDGESIVTVLSRK